MSVAEERLLSELKNIRKDHKFLYFARPLKQIPLNDSKHKNSKQKTIMSWICGFPGPSTELYKNSYFYLKLDFNERYPFYPPRVTFTRPVYHPNVYINNGVCLDVISHKWKASMNVMQIISAVQHLLEQPNSSSPANTTANNLYVKYKEKYKKKVRENILKEHSIFPWSEKNVWKDLI
ncbi:Ubiquitin conjugating enzyme E2 [Spraguea lophii 42_110]|uniref:Ubiquitin conjugating enzyme E2 n=1 Tax=Spraguea lophii (strain 42_110) TaxID=1358809 RepID=S7XUP3_SPRLO|nr:Ubiquitin conjugating enzyme E2 [Spraguea lophii 42_110]